LAKKPTDPGVSETGFCGVERRRVFASGRILFCGNITRGTQCDGRESAGSVLFPGPICIYLSEGVVFIDFSLKISHKIEYYTGFVL
jgi:hypothetical protein